MSNVKCHNSGFTLTEALVSIAIIAIISTLVVVAINGFGDKRKYELDVNNLAANYQMLRTQALASKAVDDVVPTGYCFYLANQNAEEYLLYADMNGNYQYDIGSDSVLDTVKLSHQTQIVPEPVENNDFCFGISRTLDVICDETGCGTGDKILLRIIYKETNEQKATVISKALGKVQIYEHEWPY